MTASRDRSLVSRNPFLNKRNSGQAGAPEVRPAVDSQSAYIVRILLGPFTRGNPDSKIRSTRVSGAPVSLAPAPLDRMVLEDTQISLQNHGHAVTRVRGLYRIVDQSVGVSVDPSDAEAPKIFVILDHPHDENDPTNIDPKGTYGRAFSCT